LLPNKLETPRVTGKREIGRLPSAESNEISQAAAAEVLQILHNTGTSYSDPEQHSTR
jgi:hypothetical protein